jgi:hypothetical protein
MTSVVLGQRRTHHWSLWCVLLLLACCSLVRSSDSGTVAVDSAAIASDLNVPPVDDAAAATTDPSKTNCVIGANGQEECAPAAQDNDTVVMAPEDTSNCVIGADGSMECPPAAQDDPEPFQPEGHSEDYEDDEEMDEFMDHGDETDEFEHEDHEGEETAGSLDVNEAEIEDCTDQHEQCAYWSSVRMDDDKRGPMQRQTSTNVICRALFLVTTARRVRRQPSVHVVELSAQLQIVPSRWRPFGPITRQWSHATLRQTTKRQRRGYIGTH